jgi:hypothetical protein
MHVLFTKNGIVFGKGLWAFVIAISRKQAQHAYNKYLYKYDW